MYPTADETIAAAVKKNDISLALYAIAIRANVNLVDERGVHLVYNALAAADGTKDKEEGAPPAKDPKDPTFPLAELLLQNGASIAAVNGSTPLPVSSAAKGYISMKSAKAGGSSGTDSAYQATPGSSSGVAAANGGVGSSNGSGSNTEEKQKKESKEDKLRKRVSTSGRIVKQQILDSVR